MVIYRYISDINVLCSIHCKRMSLLNVESYVFINVFYLVSFCIHVCVDDSIKKKIYIYIYIFDALPILCVAWFKGRGKWIGLHKIYIAILDPSVFLKPISKRFNPDTEIQIQDWEHGFPQGVCWWNELEVVFTTITNCIRRKKCIFLL